jgi:Cysteine-rich CPXCG
VGFRLNPDPQGWAGDENLDEDFPLGDGTAQTDAAVTCPYCGEEVEVALDPGSGTRQEYVEDCEVCCRPWLVHVAYAEDGTADVWLETTDGT